MKRLPVVLLALCLASALLVACGDDGDDGGSEAPTKSEYLADADAICLRVNQDLQQLSEKQFLGGSGAEMINEGLSELEALPEPEGDEDQLAAIYAAGHAGVANIGTATNEDPFQQFHDLAAAYGFKKGCTENA